MLVLIYALRKLFSIHLWKYLGFLSVKWWIFDGFFNYELQSNSHIIVEFIFDASWRIFDGFLFLAKNSNYGLQNCHIIVTFFGRCFNDEFDGFPSVRDAIVTLLSHFISYTS